MKKNLLISLLLIITVVLSGQQWMNDLPQEKTRNGELNFFEIQNSFNDYWEPLNVKEGFYYENGEKIKAGGWKQFKRWEWFWESRVDQQTGAFPKTNAYYEFKKYMKENPWAKSASGNWVTMGPSSTNGGYAGLGRLNCVAFRPGDNNTIYTGAPAGGVWKSTNGGSSWTVLGDENASIGVSDIIVIAGGSPSTDIVYIATGDRDHGDTYSIGVLKSTNGGSSWSSTGLSFSQGQLRTINRLLIDPNNNNVLYAATSNGLKKTTNAGSSWSNINSNNFIDIEFKPGNSQYIYAANKNGDIYRSTNGGSNWSQVLSTSQYRVELAVSAANPSIVYAVLVQNNSGLYGIYKSTNSGSSFSQVFSGSNLLGWDCNGGDSGGQGWYDLAMAADPNNANIVFVGGVNTWKSTNGGNSWSINNHWSSSCGGSATTVHADKHFLAYQNGSSTLFECNDGGIYKTSNSGYSWTHLGNGIVASQIYRIGVAQTVATDVVCGLQDNGTKNLSGSLWDDVLGGDGMDCAIDFTNANIQYGESQNGNIRRTTNHWSSYTSITSGLSGNPAWVTPYVIDPNNHNTLFLGYQDVFKSTNQGSSWTKISNWNGSSLRSIAVAPSNSNYIYTATYDDIYRSTNGGNTWTNISSGLSNESLTYISVKNNDPNTIWVSFSGFNSHGVYRSTNGGSSWINISSGLPQLPVNCVIQNKQNTSQVELYAGTDVGVYMKLGNSNWIPFFNGLPNVVVNELEIYYNNSNQSLSRIRAATFGRGLWESDLYSVSSPPVANFSASPLTPEINQSVNFTDLSTNNPTSWQWSFSGPGNAVFVNGTNANSTNPKVQFDALGFYTATLYVSNTYGNDTETKTNYIEVVGGSTLNPPTNLTAQVVNDNDVNLSWTAPAGGGGEGEWIQWDTGENEGNGIGLTSGGTFYIASHWIPSDLTAYNGKSVSQMSFFPQGDANATFTLKIWTGTNANTEVMSQDVGSYIVDDFNIINLNNPVTINPSTEYWFGYEVTHNEGTHPAGVDPGPAVQEKGDMISFDVVSWTSMSISYDLDFNWNIAIYVDDSKGVSQPQAITKPVYAVSSGAITENGTSGTIKTFDPGQSKALTGYNVFRDGVFIAYTTESNYVDQDLMNDTYNYCATAVYDEGESNCSNTASATISGGGELNPPTNLTAQVVTENNVDLNWIAPDGGGGAGEWIQWDTGENIGNGIGLTNGGTFYVASHWMPSDLTPYNGRSVTQMSFFPQGATDAIFKLKIWTGPNAGSEVMSQDVGSYIVDDFNIINLNNPITINPLTEYWFGYEIYHNPGTNPAGVDPGPAIQEMGDMISFDVVSWTSMSDSYGLDYNWNIAIYADDSKGVSQPLAITKPTYTVTNGTFSEKGETGTINTFDPGQTKSLTGYNVYRNGLNIGYTTEIFYTDLNLADGIYNYCVTAVYDEGESVCSNNSNVIINENSYFEFEDDFDTYNENVQLACQNPDDWTTWYEDPCSTADPYIVTDIVNSIPNSVLIEGENDLVHVFPNYTEGAYLISFKMYIPEGFDGYFNTLANFNSNASTWGMAVNFFQSGGSVDAGGQSAAVFDVLYNEWFLNEVFIDLDNDWATFKINGEEIIGWVWSTGNYGNGDLNQLGGSNFYAGSDTQLPKYYFDDYVVQAFDPAAPLAAPTNLTGPASVDIGEDIDLNWDVPENGIWIHWDSGENSGNGIGLTSGGTFYAASHWTPSEISVYDGLSVSKLSFFPYGDPNATFILKVWTGPEAGTEILSQDLNNYNVNEWNEVELTNPILLNGSTEYWFGYQVTHSEGSYPAGIDEGPAVVGSGDMISMDGLNWVSIGETYSIYNNFNIQAYVGLPNKTISGPISKPTKLISKSGKITSAGKMGAANSVTKQFVPNEGKSLLGYNVFRNGTVIGYTTESSYTDISNEPGTFYYCVTAIYDEGESPCSNVAEVLVEDCTTEPPTELTAQISGEINTQLDWIGTTCIGLLGYNIYRNNENIDFVTETTYLDENLENGTYNYCVTALFDESETNCSNTESVTIFTCIPDPPANLFATVIGETDVHLNWSAPVCEDLLGYNVYRNDENIDYVTSTSYIDSGLEDGSYNYCVTAVYDEGETDCSNTASVIIFTCVPDPPTNLSADIVDDINVELYWDEPSCEDLLGYNIYRNDENIDFVTSTNYFDSNLENGTYNYCVTAVYDEGETDCSNTASVTIYLLILDPPTNLWGTLEYNDITLCWDAPGSGDWLHWDNGENAGNGIGLTSGGTFLIASHWTASELIPYVGMSVSQMSFFPYGDPAATYILKIWTGPNAGTEVMSQDINTFNPDQWNEVNLTGPVMIASSTEYWFGYATTHSEGTNPAGVDTGPAIQGSGDMISIDGSNWVSMGAEYNLDFNWNLQVFVENLKNASPPETITKTIFNTTGGTITLNTKLKGDVIPFAPSTAKSLLGFNVYRDGTLLAFTTENCLTESCLPPGDSFTYCVTAVYDEGESECSNDFIITEVSFPVPQNLAYSIDENNVVLEWDAVKGFDGYNVYHSFNSGDFDLLNSEPLSGNTYTYNDATIGYHEFYVKALYCEWESDPSNTVQFTIVGVEENHLGNIKVYPNPASDFVMVNSETVISNLKLFSNTGQLVLDVDVLENDYKVNLSDFDNGVYLIKIETEKRITVKRIIKR